MAAGDIDTGLSPRVRGNLFILSGNENTVRSIPACAGEPAGASLSSARSRVYPRVCGGTPLMAYNRRDSKGLSPRVRGNLEVVF